MSKKPDMRSTETALNSVHMILIYFVSILLGMTAAAAVVLILSAGKRISYRRAVRLLLAIGAAGMTAGSVLLFY
ncbi:MAG: hypothetical protein ACOCW5_04110 [Spirochaetia bacterium]